MPLPRRVGVEISFSPRALRAKRFALIRAAQAVRARRIERSSGKLNGKFLPGARAPGLGAGSVGGQLDASRQGDPIAGGAVRRRAGSGDSAKPGRSGGAWRTRALQSPPAETRTLRRAPSSPPRPAGGRGGASPRDRVPRRRRRRSSGPSGRRRPSAPRWFPCSGVPRGTRAGGGAPAGRPATGGRRRSNLGRRTVRRGSGRRREAPGSRSGTRRPGPRRRTPGSGRGRARTEETRTAGSTVRSPEASRHPRPERGGEAPAPPGSPRGGSDPTGCGATPPRARSPRRAPPERRAASRRGASARLPPGACGPARTGARGRSCGPRRVRRRRRRIRARRACEERAGEADGNRLADQAVQKLKRVHTLRFGTQRERMTMKCMTR